MKKYLYIISLLIFLPCLAWGATYHIKQTATGTEDGSSEANADSVTAFNADTINNGNSKLVAGDTVHFYDTITTTIVPPVSGSLAGGDLTLDGYAAGNCDPITSECTSSAEIDFSGEYGIYSNKDYITIQDFRTANVNHGILVAKGSDHVAVRRCYTHDHKSAGIKVHCRDGTRCSHIIIGGADGEGNKIVDTGTTDGEHLFQADLVDDLIVSYNYMTITDTDNYGSEGIVIYDVNRVLVEYNHVSNVDKIGGVGERGIGAKGHNSDVIFRFNHVHDCQDGGIIFINGMNNGYIYGNRVHNNKYSGIAIAPQVGDYGNEDLTNIYVWSNVVFENWARALTIENYSGSGTTDNIYFYNNTVADNGNQAEGDTKNAGFYCDVGTNIYVKNNIFSNNKDRYGTEQEIWTNNSGNITLGNNNYYDSGGPATLTGISMEGDAEEADPKFENAANDDYRLNGDNNVDDGTDLSASFPVNIGGGDSWFETYSGYPETITIKIDYALDPAQTDWTAIPPTVQVDEQEKYGSWERGAYYCDEVGDTQAPLFPGCVSGWQILPEPYEVGDPTDAITMTICQASDNITIPANLQYRTTNPTADMCGDNAGTGQTHQDWTADDRNHTDTGLEPNHCYDWLAQCRDEATNTVDSLEVYTYTHANIPVAPEFVATETTAIITNGVAITNGNPDTNPRTYYAIYFESSAPTDSNRDGTWMDANGEPSASEVWHILPFKSLIIIGSGGTPLVNTATYQVQVKARNQMGEETDLSDAGTLTTGEDTTAPTPNPATFATAPAGLTTTSINMISTTGVDINTVSYSFDFDPDGDDCGSDADIGTGGTDSGWQASTTYTDDGLEINQKYCYEVQMRDTIPNTGTASALAYAYTLAAIPGTPTFENEADTTVEVLLNDANGNPPATPTTLFAMQCTAVGGGGDADWFEKWVQADGSAGASEAWLSDAALEALTIIGLDDGKKYWMAVKAKNGDDDETSLSSPGYFTTTGDISPVPTAMGITIQ